MLLAFYKEVITQYNPDVPFIQLELLNDLFIAKSKITEDDFTKSFEYILSSDLTDIELYESSEKLQDYKFQYYRAINSFLLKKLLKEFDYNCNDFLIKNNFTIFNNIYTKYSNIIYQDYVNFIHKMMMKCIYDPDDYYKTVTCVFKMPKIIKKIFA